MVFGAAGLLTPVSLWGLAPPAETVPLTVWGTSSTLPAKKSRGAKRVEGWLGAEARCCNGAQWQSSLDLGVQPRWTTTAYVFHSRVPSSLVEPDDRGTRRTLADEGELGVDTCFFADTALSTSLQK